MNLKFNRQHPIIYQMDKNEPKFFIADFYCHEKMLVLEVDGKIHDFQQEYDQHREDILKDRGFNILRVTNEEVENIPEVLKKIKEYILKH